MTVARLREEMPQDEFVRWNVYHGRRRQEQELQEQRAKARRR